MSMELTVLWRHLPIPQTQGSDGGQWDQRDRGLSSRLPSVWSFGSPLHGAGHFAAGVGMIPSELGKPDLVTNPST